MINKNLRFFLSHYRFFIFSMSGIFFSSPGQTFLISLAIPLICDSYGISPMVFASIYSISTLIASFFLPLIGRVIDCWPPNKIILFNTAFFFSSILLFTTHISTLTLFISLFFMRLFGQGGLPLTASSMTIKHFHQQRGTALSITQLGYPLSEFIFPGLTIIALSHLGWAPTFGIFSILIIVAYLPISLFGCREYSAQGLNYDASPSKSLSFALKDKFLPVYVALSSIPPIMMTAALYFQTTIFSHHQWPLSLTAIAIFFYALFKFFATLFIGPIIDRIGVVIPLAFLIICIGLATCIISMGGAPIIGYIYYSIYGIGLGASAATMSYLWALLYGSQHIGEIKGAISIIRNGATAIAPIGFSFVHYHLNLSLESIFMMCGIFILIMSVFPFILQRLDHRLMGPSELNLP